MICYMIRHEDKSLWAARHQPGCLGLQISSTHGLGLEVWGWAEKYETMLPGQGLALGFTEYAPAYLWGNILAQLGGEKKKIMKYSAPTAHQHALLGEESPQEPSPKAHTHAPCF